VDARQAGREEGDAMHLTLRQQEAQAIIAGTATHIMLFGGSRSGKTFLHVRNVIFRALKGTAGRHAILRFRFNHLKASIILDTFPKVMRLAYPGVDYELSKTDWYVKYENGSEVWFGGLDDKERTEKILGQEYVTLYFNECSQIPLGSVDTAITRLAQLVPTKIDGRPDGVLKPRAYYDCNPPPKSHWTYKRFVEKRDPETKQPLPKPEDYAHFQMNPEHNSENLSAGYLDTLKSLSARLQKRFLKGEFADATPNQLFAEEDIDKWRSLGGVLPDMVRVVVGVDPSGSGDVDNADNDAIGITVGGLGTDGNAYLLEDCTVKAGPKTWSQVATTAFDRHQADVVVGEVNYGGAMVQHTIQTARPRTPFKMVTATRGKAVRAEPFSALYEQGKVRHVGNFPELEDELCAFSTVGYLGNASPNRADSWIWVLAELFPGMTRGEMKARKTIDATEGLPRSWQAS
jgi:phage terminase large subunit-like protein